jgi:hypothetical protein
MSLTGLSGRGLILGLRLVSLLLLGLCFILLLPLLIDPLDPIFPFLSLAGSFSLLLLFFLFDLLLFQQLLALLVILQFLFHDFEGDSFFLSELLGHGSLVPLPLLLLLLFLQLLLLIEFLQELVSVQLGLVRSLLALDEDADALLVLLVLGN